MMKQYGTIRVKLKELLENSGISRTKLCQWAELQPTQLNRYYNGTVTRLDIDVLARICTVLNCKIEDLIEFVPANEE